MCAALSLRCVLRALPAARCRFQPLHSAPPPSPPQTHYDIKNDCGEVLFTKEQIADATKRLGRQVRAARERTNSPLSFALRLLSCAALNVQIPSGPPTPPPTTKQIAADYRDKAPLLVPILKGAFIFAADLVRALDPSPLNTAVEFVTARSYGAGFETSGEVQVEFDAAAVRGRHCVMVDDL